MVVRPTCFLAEEKAHPEPRCWPPQAFTRNRTLVAKRHGLVDTIGFVESAVERAIELAGLDEDDVRVVRYEKPKSLFELASSARTGGGMDFATYLELSVPRAYYLTTSLPPLVSTYSQ